MARSWRSYVPLRPRHAERPPPPAADMLAEAQQMLAQLPYEDVEAVVRFLRWRQWLLAHGNGVRPALHTC